MARSSWSSLNRHPVLQTQKNSRGIDSCNFYRRISSEWEVTHILPTGIHLKNAHQTPPSWRCLDTLCVWGKLYDGVCRLVLANGVSVDCLMLCVQWNVFWPAFFSSCFWIVFFCLSSLATSFCSFQKTDQNRTRISDVHLIRTSSEIWWIRRNY